GPAARRAPALNPEAGIEEVAETAAEEVEAQAREGERHPREEADPEGLADHVLAARDDVTPRRHVGRHAHAEKAKDRLGEDGVGEDEAALDEERTHAVGQDVAQRDGRVLTAERARRL